MYTQKPPLTSYNDQPLRLTPNNNSSGKKNQILFCFLYIFLSGKLWEKREKKQTNRHGNRLYKCIVNERRKTKETKEKKK